METLVLSPAFEPLARVPWRRALVLVLARKAELVEPYEQRARSLSLELPVPSVVRHLRARRVVPRPVRFSRQNIYARDRGRCQYCGAALARDAFTFDHVLPRSRGGRTCWENIVAACVPCNRAKGGRTPAEAGLRLAAAPRRPRALPGGPRPALAWERGMPAGWRQWLRDASYWHGALASDA